MTENAAGPFFTCPTLFRISGVQSQDGKGCRVAGLDPILRLGVHWASGDKVLDAKISSIVLVEIVKEACLPILTAMLANFKEH